MSNRISAASKKKGIVTAIIVVIMVIFLYTTGVLSIGSGIKFGWKENIGNDEWKASYWYFTGTREKELDIPKKNGTLHLNIKTSSGKISVKIIENDGEVLFSKDNIKSMEKTLFINGNVKIKVTAKGHRGSFEFSG